MTEKETIQISLWAIVVLAVAIGMSWWLDSQHPSTELGKFADSSAALAFISGAALTIERLTEMFWTVLGGTIGTFWPLNAVARQVNAMAEDLDTSLTPFQAPLKADLDELAKKESWADNKIQAAKLEIDSLEKRFDEMKQYPPSNQRFQLLVAAASQNVEYLAGKYGEALPHLKQAKTVVELATTGLQDFLASFKDNPGRRLISIYLGCLMGVLVAGLFHLNAFATAMAVPTTNASTAPHHLAAIIFTGLLMGLGANPTHEVIRAIQEFKKSQKGDNALTPNQ